MQIVLNGESRNLNEPLTVAELLRRHELEPLRVAVEVNEELVRRASFEQRLIRDGDRVEIVTLVGGG